MGKGGKGDAPSADGSVSVPQCLELCPLLLIQGKAGSFKPLEDGLNKVSFVDGKSRGLRGGRVRLDTRVHVVAGPGLGLDRGKRRAGLVGCSPQCGIDRAVLQKLCLADLRVGLVVFNGHEWLNHRDKAQLSIQNRGHLQRPPIHSVR